MLRSVQSESIYELNVHIILVLKPECVEMVGILVAELNSF